MPVNGFQTASDVAGVDLEANQLAVPDKARPDGYWAKVDQDHMQQVVTAHAFATALTSHLDPAVRPDFDQGLRDLLAHVRAARQADPQNAQLQTAGSALETAIEKFDQNMTDLARTKPDFLRSEARAKTGNKTVGDTLRRNLAGKEDHAVLVRSLLQAGIVTGSTALLQLGIQKAMKDFFSESQNRIPDDLLKEVAKDLGKKSPTDADVIRHAIKELSKPGSTYLDEASNGIATIMGVEAGIGMIRGTVLPIADNKNEISARAGRMQGAVDNAREPAPEQTGWQKARKSMMNAAPDQFKYSAYSGAVAAAAQLVAGKEAPGWKHGVEVVKTMGFSGLQAAGNVAADGARAAMKLDPDGAATQWVKFALRVVGRAVAQTAKTGISQAQSLGEGTMSQRSIAGDYMRAGIMGVGGGVLKEVAGTAAQTLTNKALPPDEAAMLHTTKTINAAADVLRSIATLRDLGVAEPHLQPVEGPIDQAFAAVIAANTMEFNSADFDVAFRNYAADVNQTIVEERLGSERPPLRS